MPPRKLVRPAPPRPTDEEVIQAINTHEAAAEASQKAYEDMMRARERLVAVLRARGVLGFSSI